jgi:hypothetical protein
MNIVAYNGKVTTDGSWGRGEGVGGTEESYIMLDMPLRLWWYTYIGRS